MSSPAPGHRFAKAHHKLGIGSLPHHADDSKMPGLLVLSQTPVSLAELAHLETRRPDDDRSGYKNVFAATHGTGWRVRLKVGGALKSLKGIYPSPREAAKSLVRFYREKFGPEWMGRVREGWYIPEPPTERPWYVPQSWCRDARRHPTSRGYCPELARMGGRRKRPRLRAIEADGYRIFEQDPGEWVITAQILGHTVYVDKPGPHGWFHTRDGALVFLGMYQRTRWPWLGLRILGEPRRVDRLPQRNHKPWSVIPLSAPTRRPRWRRLPEVWRQTPSLPFAG